MATKRHTHNQLSVCWATRTKPSSLLCVCWLQAALSDTLNSTRATRVCWWRRASKWSLVELNELAERLFNWRAKLSSSFSFSFQPKLFSSLSLSLSFCVCFCATQLALKVGIEISKRRSALFFSSFFFFFFVCSFSFLLVALAFTFAFVPPTLLLSRSVFAPSTQEALYLSAHSSKVCKQQQHSLERSLKLRARICRFFYVNLHACSRERERER